MGKQVCLSRRAAVGGALAIGASALAGSSAAGTLAERAWAQDAGESGGNAADKGAQYGFLIKARNCVDCGECVKACRLWSRTPASAEARRKVVPYVTKSGKEAYLSTSCMHCETPSCAAVCPAGAITKGDGGVVTVNKERCIGASTAIKRALTAYPTTPLPAWTNAIAAWERACRWAKSRTA